MPITLAEKIVELRREIGYRERVYPKIVAAGRLSQAKADHHIEIMREILRDYEKQIAPQGDMFAP